MKIMAREYEKAEKTTSTIVLLKIIGVINFFAAFFTVFSFSEVYQRELGKSGKIVCIVFAFIAGASAAAIAFVLADILEYLHAIRWNTDGYALERDKEDMRLLSRAIDRLSDNIDRIVNADHVEAIDEDEPEESQENDSPDNDPYDNFE